MRRIALVFVVAGLVGGGAAAEAGTLSLSSNGRPAAVFELPAGWKAKTRGAETTVSLPTRGAHIQLWPVPKAKNVAEAVPMVADLIKEEVVDFKPDSVKDVTVAGVPGKHLVGTGTEVDDNDPSNVEVVLFAVGNHVFLSCAHDDADGAARNRSSILKMLDTARAP